MTGLFITLEGPDGAGKTTQVRRLTDWLVEQRIPFIVTREPGGTAISDAVRSVLLDPTNKEMGSQTEILLYAASRAQHIHEKILPALERGWVVLCDRFVDASVAYQGYGLEMPIESIESINAFATGGLIPDRTYLIDLPSDIGRERLEARSGRLESQDLDRIEQKQLSYHERVRDGFRRIYKENPKRILLVDGTQTEDQVYNVIKEDLTRVLRQANQIN